MSTSETGHITRALAANAAIAVAKATAAAATGSGAMFAEAIHSASDCANQGLLLLGLRQARQGPDADHPLGHGRALYFWSFLVALLLFSGGGVFSVYEGIHKLMHPEPLSRVWLAVLILAFSVVLEGWAMANAVSMISRRKGGLSFWRYLRDSKDSDLLVVFGEDLAALLGLTCALAAVLLAHCTGDPMWDALGSVAVGGVLIAVAVFLAVKVQSLLLGEAADPVLVEAARQAAAADPRLKAVGHIMTLQQGPGEVVVVLKIACDPGLPASELSDAINAFEARLRAARPDARWVFVEPDLGPEMTPPPSALA